MAMLLAMPALAGAPLPELNGTLKNETPYGTGALTWLWMTAYDAELWTDAESWSMESPFALSLTYHMAFSSEDIVSRTEEELAKVSDVTAEQLAAWRPQLQRAIPPVREGDRITALYVPGQRVQFFMNGQPTGKISDPDFAAPFFAIWLSEKTSEPGLRAALLKGRQP
jgi:hypothetical protein